MKGIGFGHPLRTLLRLLAPPSLRERGDLSVLRLAVKMLEYGEVRN